MISHTCPFCKKDIKKSTFSESENFIAIVNIAPVLPGHSLIVPKKHLKSFMDLSDEELFEMVKFSRKVVKILNSFFKTNAFDWTIQDNEEAGQTIPHLHLHIIPRIKNDLPDPGDWYPMLKNNFENSIDSRKRSKLKETEMKQMVTFLRKIALNDF